MEIEVKQPAERSRGDTLNQAVLSISEGLELGRVKQVLLDGSSYCVQGFVVERRRGGKDDRILPLAAVSGFGEDGLTVEHQSLLERKGASSKYIRALRQPLPVVGARVFTAGGKNLGQVLDYRFSPTDGRITALEVDGGLFQQPRLVPGDGLIAISPQTVMLKERAIDQSQPLEPGAGEDEAAIAPDQAREN